MKLILTYPMFRWLPALAQHHEGLLIKSPTAYAKAGQRGAPRYPVVTGPFTLATWAHHTLIVLDANPNDWKLGFLYLESRFSTARSI